MPIDSAFARCQVSTHEQETYLNLLPLSAEITNLPSLEKVAWSTVESYMKFEILSAESTCTPLPLS